MRGGKGDWKLCLPFIYERAPVIKNHVIICRVVGNVLRIFMSLLFFPICNYI